MREPYPFLLGFVDIEDGVVLRGEECTTPVLIPRMYFLDVVNIVIM